MTKEAGLKGRFVNHTVRKRPSRIRYKRRETPRISVAIHKNVSSISHYASARKAQIKQMNETLLNPSKHLSKIGLQIFPKSAYVRSTITVR